MVGVGTPGVNIRPMTGFRAACGLHAPEAGVAWILRPARRHGGWQVCTTPAGQLRRGCPYQSGPAGDYHPVTCPRIWELWENPPMMLSPREIEKLYVYVVADLARKCRDRGLKLN